MFMLIFVQVKIGRKTVNMNKMGEKHKMGKKTLNINKMGI